MHAISVRSVPAWVGKALAILSVVFSWVLPWSPLLAIVALKTTLQQPGWHKIAVAGAVLCAAFSIAAGLLMVSGGIWIWLHL